MSEPQTQPILVRDDTVVPTAVGVSDPSLTLVEFVHGIGFFLAESFQHDSFTGLASLENVSLRKYSGHSWSASEHERVMLCWDIERGEEFEQFVGELGVSTNPWMPVVFFLTTSEYFTHRESLQARRPEQVLRAALASAAKVKALKAELSALWSSQRDALERLLVPPPSKVQPRKETVRISLPPKPAVKQTVRLSLPPRPSAAKETIRSELPPSKAPPSPAEKASLMQWLKEVFLKKGPHHPPPPKPASKEAIQNALSQLTPEERAEIERWLKEQKPPEDPPPPQP
ncbi:MAG: hypothetical protein WCS99_02835 [Limisphaerales bacterium]